MKKEFKAEKRKQMVIMGLIVVVGMGAYLILPEILGGKKKQGEIPKVKIFDKEKEEKQSFKALYNERLKSLEVKLEGLEKENKKLKERLESIKKEGVPISRTNIQEGEIDNDGKLRMFAVPPPPPPEKVVSAKPASIVKKIGEDLTEKTLEPVVQPQVVVKVVSVNNVLDVSNFSSKKKVIRKKKSKKKKKPTVKIVPGSFVKARILNGFNAHTGMNATSKASPVTMIITGEVQLPNDYTVDLRDCFLMGAATGDLSSKRAKIRLEKLSCINDKGETIVKKVEGSINGPDGQEGVLGKVVYKQSEVLRNSAIAGALEGISKVMQMQASTLSISPQGFTTAINPSRAGSAAIFGGSEEVAKTLSKFYGKILDLTFPVVDVPAGVPVEVTFLSTVDIEDISKGEKK